MGSGFKVGGLDAWCEGFDSLPRTPKIGIEALLQSSAGLQHAALRKVVEQEDSQTSCSGLGR